MTPASTHSNCVTKHYSRNAFGSGSVLATEAFAREMCRVDARGRTQLIRAPPLDAASAASTLPSAQNDSGGGVSEAEGPLSKRRLRYLTPREVANLKGFPAQSSVSSHPSRSNSPAAAVGSAGFSLPPGLSDSQAYALLGNSLSVDVVAYLMAYLFWRDRGTDRFDEFIELQYQ